MGGSSGGGSMSQPLQQMLFHGQPWQQNNSFSGSPFGMLMQRLQQMRQQQPQQSMPQIGMSPLAGSAIPQLGVSPPAGTMSNQPPNPPAGSSFMTPGSPIGQLSSIAGNVANQFNTPGSPTGSGQPTSNIDPSGFPGGLLSFLSAFRS